MSLHPLGQWEPLCGANKREPAEYFGGILLVHPKKRDLRTCESMRALTKKTGIEERIALVCANETAKIYQNFWPMRHGEKREINGVDLARED